MPGSGRSASPIAYLPWERYATSIRRDTNRLLEVAAPELGAPVPTCPGWSMEDLVRHVAAVFLRKVECMRRGARPDPWPPDWLQERDALEVLDEARDTLLEELAARDPLEERCTWWEPDQTNGFWYRRMALEVAVHLVDAELARVDEPGHGESVGVQVAAVEDDVALDGIDEVLRIFLAGPWWDGDFHTEHPLDARLRVTASGRSWTVTATESSVVVREETDSDVRAEIAGSASDVFLWLWGRETIEALLVSGDEDLAEELRARIAECLG